MLPSHASSDEDEAESLSITWIESYLQCIIGGLTSPAKSVVANSLDAIPRSTYQQLSSGTLIARAAIEQRRYDYGRRDASKYERLYIHNIGPRT